MGNQASAVTGRVGSIGHDIETGGSPHQYGVDQMEMTTTAGVAAAGGGVGGGGGATDHQEEEEAHIQTLGSAGGGEGATDEFAVEQQSVQRERDSGIFPSIGAATLSVAAAAILRPTPGGLRSEHLLAVAYTLDLIALLVLGILLFGLALALALALIPDNWVPAVRAAATTVTTALLVLLLLLVAFVTYGLVRQVLP